jgi:sec-independent protein translocase protein TatB
MEFLDVGINELIVILILAAVILGPERLARTAREMGKLVRNLKSYFGSLNEELKAELEILDELNEVKKEITRF